MGSTQIERAQAQLRAGVYARLSETYDPAESVPTQLERGTAYARRRGWQELNQVEAEALRNGRRGAARRSRIFDPLW